MNQSEVQRYLACKNLRVAQIAVYLNVIGLWIIMILAGFTGMVAYAYFQHCDPYSMGWVDKTDQTIPYSALESFGFMARKIRVNILNLEIPSICSKS